MPYVVQRMIAPAPNELPVIEWLVAENPPTWRRRAAGAIFFPTHGEADTKAEELRSALHMPGIFAAQRDPEIEPELPLHGEYSAPVHFNSRQQRHDWREGIPNAGLD